MIDYFITDLFIPKFLYEKNIKFMILKVKEISIDRKKDVRKKIYIIFYQMGFKNIFLIISIIIILKLVADPLDLRQLLVG